MAKHFETFEHTADIGLAAKADSLGELFEALAEGLAEMICPRGQVEPLQTRGLTVEAEDIEALAVDALTDVMNMIQTDRFAVSAVRVKRAEPTALEAELLGEPYDPARHVIDREVKAVTYHQLRIARDGEMWTGRVILDI